MILIVYDATNDKAYWLYVQAAFAGARRFRAARGSKQLTLRLPIKQVLDRNTVGRWRGFLENIREKNKGTLHHD